QLPTAKMAALILFVLLSVTLAHGSYLGPFEEVGPGGNCWYYFSSSEGRLATWLEARDYCHELGEILELQVDLAEVDTSKSCNSDDLMDTIKSKQDYAFHMGGSDVTVEGTWVWQHSQEVLPLSSSRWLDGLPYGDTDFNCLLATAETEHILDTAYFYDGYCDNIAPFVCQIFN
ncbi:unnamed protein product, partial [Meganyctiphanes norvegica]